MDSQFWQKRWQRNQIGFHLNEVNPSLIKHWPGLSAGATGRVLVPLCGKSLDLAWLARQGHRVLGVELAESAAQAFFAEQGVQPQISEEGAFRVYRHGQIEIYCGDFFALTAEQACGCELLYDRAALIALPESMRGRYVEHLQALLPSGSQGLLVTLDYAQQAMPGPPFAVSDAEVHERYAAHWSVRRLEALDAMEERFRQRGLERLEEQVYRLQRI